MSAEYFAARPFKLKDRRRSLMCDLLWRRAGGENEAHLFHLDIGFHDDGSGREIFASGNREGVTIKVMLEHSAMLASFALQSGYTLTDLNSRLAASGDKSAIRAMHAGGEVVVVVASSPVAAMINAALFIESESVSRPWPDVEAVGS